MDTKTRDIIIRLLSARVVELERQNGELLAHLDVTTPSLEMLRPLVESNHSAYMLEIKLLRDTINRSEQPQQQLTVESVNSCINRELSPLSAAIAERKFTLSFSLAYTLYQI